MKIRVKKGLQGGTQLYNLKRNISEDVSFTDILGIDKITVTYGHNNNKWTKSQNWISTKM